MKRLAILVSALASLTVLPASAQFQKPEDAIKYRQSVFTVMNNHLGRVAAMAQGRTPFDAKVAADNMAVVAMMSKLPAAGFGAGTDKGAPTRAKANIWTEGPKFTAAYEKMVGEVGKLDAAAKTGNLDNIKAAFGNVGAACKACHDDFRASSYSN